MVGNRRYCRPEPKKVFDEDIRAIEAWNEMERNGLGLELNALVLMASASPRGTEQRRE